LTEFSKIIILAEDARQQRFVRRYLYKAGFGTHVIDPEPLPEGTGGAGEHWVRKRYPVAVKKYRKRAVRAKTALIVAIDADTEEVRHRVRQLESSLEQEKLDPRTDGEAIVHLIPKRNIETWILHLNGEDLDEVQDHRNRDLDDLIPSAAAAFHGWTSQPPAKCLPSLDAALQETKRLA
jgi:hypothetical protein